MIEFQSTDYESKRKKCYRLSECESVCICIYLCDCGAEKWLECIAKHFAPSNACDHLAVGQSQFTFLQIPNMFDAFLRYFFRGFAVTFSITFFTNYTDNHLTEELKGKSVNISHFDWTCEENREPTITSNNSTWTLMINGAKKENSTSTHIVYVDIYIWRR